jgi:hypothetical protein
MCRLLKNSYINYQYISYPIIIFPVVYLCGYLWQYCEDLSLCLYCVSVGNSCSMRCLEHFPTLVNLIHSPCLTLKVIFFCQSFSAIQDYLYSQIILEFSGLLVYFFTIILHMIFVSCPLTHNQWGQSHMLFVYPESSIYSLVL